MATSRRRFLLGTAAVLLAGCGREPKPPPAGPRVRPVASHRISGELVSAAFLPDGRTVVCGDAAGVVHEVDTRDGASRVIGRGDARVWAVAARPDGTVAWGAESGELRLRRPGSRRPRRLPTEGDGVFSLAWHGERLAAGLGSGAVALHGEGRAERLEGLLGIVLGVAWSRDGRLAAGTVSGDAMVWEGRRARPLRYPDDDFGQDVNGVAWSDAATVATASQDGVVRFWSARERRIVARLPAADGWLRALAVSPDGGLLAIAGADGRLRLASTRSRRVLTTSTLTDASIWGLAWAPGGRMLAGCGGDGTLHVVEVVP